MNIKNIIRKKKNKNKKKEEKKYLPIENSQRISKVQTINFRFPNDEKLKSSL